MEILDQFPSDFYRPSDPVVIKDLEIKRLFGIVAVKVLIEDRRPDMSGENYTSKYKTQIHVKVFGKTVFTFVGRAPNLAFIGTKGIMSYNETSYEEQ